MTRASCPDCRLRFTPAVSAQLSAQLSECPVCGGSLQVIDRPESAVGFRLYVPKQASPSLPDTVAVSVPIPDPSTRRS
jgi:hypothetical protein